MEDLPSMKNGPMKFKAYDTINMQFIDLHHIIIHSNGGIISVQDLDGEQYGLHQVDLLRSIGVLDTSGNDVYEGFIVSNGDNYPSIVRYNNEECKFELHELDPGIKEIYHDINFETCGLNVIGNIYDNQDLLTEWAKVKK